MLSRDLKLSIHLITLSILKSLCQLFVIYTTPFYNFKISIPNGSASLFGEMTSVQRQGRFAQRSQVTRAFTDWSNDKNHENPLESNKPGSSETCEAFDGPSEALEAPIKPPKALLPISLALDVARYT